MSNIFNKLKVFPAICRFCGEKGMTASVVMSDNSEIAVCEACAGSIIAGVDAVIAEQKKAGEEIAKTKEAEAKVSPEAMKEKLEINESEILAEKLNQKDAVDIPLDK